MSTMRSDHKPPLARSPLRLRPRRLLRSNATAVQTPPGSLTKSQLPNRLSDVEEPELQPEYRTISCELRALARMVQDEFGNPAGIGDTFGSISSISSSPLFERGRFYEEYSARRNERLKRKKGEKGDEKKTPYDLGVKVESAKRRGEKRFDSLRKLAPSTPAATATSDRRENPRYLLRSMSKENKKPPLPATNSEKSTVAGDRKSVARRVVRKS